MRLLSVIVYVLIYCCGYCDQLDRVRFHIDSIRLLKVKHEPRLEVNLSIWTYGSNSVPISAELVSAAIKQMDWRDTNGVEFRISIPVVLDASGLREARGSFVAETGKTNNVSVTFECNPIPFEPVNKCLIIQPTPIPRKFEYYFLWLFSFRRDLKDMNGLLSGYGEVLFN